MTEHTIIQLSRYVGWATVLAVMVTLFLPKETIKFGAAITWGLLGVYIFLDGLRGYVTKIFWIGEFATEYSGRGASVATIVMMCFAVVTCILPAIAWLCLQAYRALF